MSEIIELERRRIKQCENFRREIQKVLQVIAALKFTSSYEDFSKFQGCEEK